MESDRLNMVLCFVSFIFLNSYLSLYVTLGEMLSQIRVNPDCVRFAIISLDFNPHRKFYGL